jgi:hypothetical protein
VTTSTLTADMIQSLRDEAAAAGDEQMVRICDDAAAGSLDARGSCAACINVARAMDDSKPFVRVVP